MDLTQNELDHLRTVMNAEIDRLIAARKSEVKQWPQDGDAYFYVFGSGTVSAGKWENLRQEQDALSIGNVFKTEAEANRRVEAMKVQAELRRMPGVCRWDSNSYFISFCNGDDMPKIRQSGSFTSMTAAIGGVWFEGPVYAKSAIETIGQNRLQIWLDDYLQTPI